MALAAPKVQKRCKGKEKGGIGRGKEEKIRSYPKNFKL